MSQIRVCFLGTTDFAVTCLERVYKDPHYHVVGVITQPDRPAGRKLQLHPSSVKSFCLANNIKVISPESVNRQIILDEIASWGAEVGIVVAFGQILGDAFLKLFPLGSVNVHASLLPRWRGAAPIQRSIEAGDTVTGVALQKIVKELDAGDVIGERKFKVSENLNSLELHNELAILGADLLHVELMDYIRGNLIPMPQDKTLVTVAKKINKQESQLDWNLPAQKLHDKVRAFVWGPGTFTLQNTKKIKIHKTVIKSLSETNGPAGSVALVSQNELVINCGVGQVSLLELQPESRNKMKIEDFLKGHSLKKGDVFGS